jgi:hypothetical protein
MTDDQLDEVRRRLAEDWGLEGRRLRALVCELARGGWRSRRDLVELRRSAARR